MISGVFVWGVGDKALLKQQYSKKMLERVLVAKMVAGDGWEVAGGEFFLKK